MDAPGYFYAPTLLAGVSRTRPRCVEEIFGPVLTLQTFETEEEALALADHPTYGLCAGVFTRDLSRALRAMKRHRGRHRLGQPLRPVARPHPADRRLQASGLGKDLGREAYHANRRSKSVLIDIRGEDA